MKYRVTWDPNAFRDLVRAWKTANQPDSGIRAFDEIERLLSDDAELQGESRDDDRRLLIVPPIGVVFRAKPDLGEALILDAWMIRPRKK